MDICQEIKVTINKTGDYYKFRAAAELTAEEAALVQEQQGYHPDGYNIFHVTVKDGCTTWHCSNCCD